jgi:hypothetical protein
VGELRMQTNVDVENQLSVTIGVLVPRVVYLTSSMDEKVLPRRRILSDKRSNRGQIWNPEILLRADTAPTRCRVQRCE